MGASLEGGFVLDSAVSVNGSDNPVKVCRMRAPSCRGSLLSLRFPYLLSMLKSRYKWHAALVFAACLCAMQPALAMTPQSVAADTLTAARKTSPAIARNELLAGIPASDLARIQAEAKRVYTKLWPIFAERSRYVRARIGPVLGRLHAPQELDVVPIVESGYNPYAFSSAGATGLWQIMPGTARVLGMRAPRGINARRNVETGTKGAVRYLLDMKARFGNWPLAFAAYHRGPGRIARAIRYHPWKPSDGLDRLPVPLITRTYVRSILGLSALVWRGVWRFPDPWPTRTLTLQGPVDLNLLARTAGISRDELFRFNPGLNHSQYLSSSLTLHSPDAMYKRMMIHVSDATPAHIRIHIRSGDNLWVLARKYRTTIRYLRHLNPGMGHLLHPGRSLLVPASRFNAAAPLPNPMLARGRRIRYRVRTGDNLWNIARRFGTTTRAIARANSLRRTAMLRPGDTLWILVRIRPS